MGISSEFFLESQERRHSCVEVAGGRRGTLPKPRIPRRNVLISRTEAKAVYRGGRRTAVLSTLQLVSAEPSRWMKSLVHVQCTLLSVQGRAAVYEVTHQVAETKLGQLSHREARFGGQHCTPLCAATASGWEGGGGRCSTHAHLELDRSKGIHKYHQGHGFTRTSRLATLAKLTAG